MSLSTEEIAKDFTIALIPQLLPSLDGTKEEDIKKGVKFTADLYNYLVENLKPPHKEPRIRSFVKEG